jgi:predicted kinase
MMFTISRQTIYLFIGPSNCGKTTFAKEYLMKHFPNDWHIHYISSDDIRRQLLDRPLLDKYHPTMLHASESAFDVLYNQLENILKFPINSDAIIVDTTGMSEDFRTKILSIAERNCYNVEFVVFAYKDRKEYFQQKGNKRIVANHVERFFKTTLKSLSRHKVRKTHRIISQNFTNIEFAVQNQYDYKLPNIYTYTIIGDIHGCYDEFIALLKLHGATIDEFGTMFMPTLEHLFILVGDLIDKGPHSKKVIAFIEENLQYFIVVQGNHENFVVQHILGNEAYQHVDEHTRHTYFTSIDEFKNDELAFASLKYIDEQSYPFVQTERFIVTHSPCANNVLGKLQNKAVRAQRNYRYIRRQERQTLNEYETALENDLLFLKEDARTNFPFHVFGHVELAEPLWLQNKLGIDTGCVAGNKLTSVTFYPSGKISWQHVPSQQPNKKELPTIYATREYTVDFDKLDRREFGRMMWMARNKVNYVSGTMAPADQLGNAFESLEWALEYYKSFGYDCVMLQKKYMGSRCQAYLHRDVEQSYAVTRNGFRIKPDYVDMSYVFQTLYTNLTNQLTNEFPLWEICIIDGELMPWSALGKSLIDHSFACLGKMIHKELEFCKYTNFRHQLQILQSNASGISRKELQQQFGNTKGDSIYYANKMNLPTYEEQLTGLQIYQKQLELYGRERDPYFLPFNLLKIVHNDGTEYINEFQHEGYQFVSSDSYCKVWLDDANIMDNAYKFFNNVTKSEQLEGIVVKPNVVKKGVAPYIKVRNNDYLHIVYGYDWRTQPKYDKLWAQKGIKRKLRLSIEEYECAQNMLRIPYGAIDENNTAYLQYAAQFIVDEKKEKELDPRL